MHVTNLSWILNPLKLVCDSWFEYIYMPCSLGGGRKQLMPIVVYCPWACCVDVAPGMLLTIERVAGFSDSLLGAVSAVTNGFQSHVVGRYPLGLCYDWCFGKAMCSWARCFLLLLHFSPALLPGSLPLPLPLSLSSSHPVSFLYLAVLSIWHSLSPSLSVCQSLLLSVSACVSLGG